MTRMIRVTQVSPVYPAAAPGQRWLQDAGWTEPSATSNGIRGHSKEMGWLLWGNSVCLPSAVYIDPFHFCLKSLLFDFSATRFVLFCGKNRGRSSPWGYARDATQPVFAAASRSIGANHLARAPCSCTCRINTLIASPGQQRSCTARSAPARPSRRGD